MKRVIALLLLCCTLAMTLVACNGGEPEATTGSGKNENVETDIYSQEALNSKTDWSTVDLEGEELTVLVRNDVKVFREWEKEEAGDEDIDSAVADRNEIVESNLNVDVSIKLVASDKYEKWKSEFVPMFTQDVDNGLHEIDIVANFGYNGMTANLRGYYVNLLDKETLPYFDFSLKCWNQGIVTNGTVNNRLYLCAGDMNLSMFDSAMIIWHNMDLYNRLKTTNDPADIQDLVIGGQWTYTQLYRWAQVFVNSGSSTECADDYGVYIQGKSFGEEPGMAIPYAWGVNFIETNADGTHSYKFAGNAKAEDVLTKFRQLYNAGGNAYDVFNETKNETCKCGIGGHFASGHILFKGDVLYWDKGRNNAIREMKDRYSLLCWPKYDTNQTDYYTTSQDYFTTMSVLDHSSSSTGTKGEAVSAYLQYGTEYSYTYVRGYYFEKIIKPKWFGTDDSDGHVSNSITIFTTIINNLSYGFETIYGPMINNVINAVWKQNVQAVDSTGTIQASYNAGKNGYDSALKDVDKWFGLIN